MMYAVIVLNLLGFAVGSAVQSMISVAADARSQGQTMGSVASLNSLMAVTAPVIAALLLGIGAHQPKGSWLVGLPFYFGAALQLAATAIAVRHFRQRGMLAAAAGSAAT
jgi:DHA1 family tetracycline resistance protein-like MFS transporter